MMRRVLSCLALALLFVVGLGSATDTNCPPEACFTWCPVCPRVMEAFRFVNCSVDPDGRITSWHWDFGDGTVSSDPEPVHQYERVGTYIVTLTVTDDAGAAATRTRDITVCRRPLVITAADLTKTYGDPYEFAGTEFDVQGLVGGDLVSSVTLSSDGAPASAKPGSYPIVPRDAVGIGLDNYDITYKEGTLTVKAPPVACFTWSPDCPKEGAPFQLTDCSTDEDGQVIAWHWELGDGTTSTDRHPTGRFERAGTYTVTLQVTDNDGLSGTVSREIVICEAIGTLSVVPGSGLLAPPKSMLLIVDASQSMGWWLGSGRDQVIRMDAAKMALRELITAMPDQLNVGLLVYYNCDRIELVLPVGPLDRTRLLAEVEKLTPTGSTPIAGALQRAGAALTATPSPSLVVLVTDGEETCGGQPIRAAQELAASGLDLRIDVIGLAVEAEPEAVAQLRGIAAAGNGTYFRAESTDELQTALRLAAPMRFSVYDASGAIAMSGAVGDQAIPLRAGRYTVVIETALGDISAEVEVASDAETRVAVEYTEGVFRARVP